MMPSEVKQAFILPAWPSSENWSYFHAVFPQGYTTTATAEKINSRREGQASSLDLFLKPKTFPESLPSRSSLV